MAVEDGILLGLFPPVSWDEEGVRLALEIQEAADGEDGGGYSDDELTFLARCVTHYMSLDPSQWGHSFSIDTQIDPTDPNEDGRFVIEMDYPAHLEPPASLR